MKEHQFDYEKLILDYLLNTNSNTNNSDPIEFDFDTNDEEFDNEPNTQKILGCNGCNGHCLPGLLDDDDCIDPNDKIEKKQSTGCKNSDCNCDGNCGDKCKCKNPKNNDGRDNCFKCGTKTEIRGMYNEYRICPKCKI